MSRRVPIALVLVTLVAYPATSAEEPDLAGCAPGPLPAAIQQLVHPGAVVSDRSLVAGFQSAVALEPLVIPGVRHRLIRAAGLWCAASGFNEAWRIAGRSPDAVSQATAFAQVVAAPYFDGVTVRRAEQVTPGVVRLETHALTNGITAAWTVAVDGAGIRHAAWTSNGFAIPPFTAEWEGVSALPGVTRTYARNGDGSLQALEPILPEPGQPELVTEGRTADDFLIRVSYGGSGFSPNIGADTGIDPVDLLRFVRKVSLANYQEFYDWGFRKDWTSNVGNVSVDSGPTLTCFACVFWSEEFNIHISSAIVEILFALGYEYPDKKEAFSTVLGHEMAHNWQSAYFKPDQNAARAHVAFTEGTARAQEAMHENSGVSHQPRSLIYHTDGDGIGPSLHSPPNTCNGWAGANIDQTFARGPFTDKTYNACYFWLSWHARHGVSGIVDLFAAMRDNVKKSAPRQVIDTLQQATGGTFAEDLAAFARASITGKGYEWPAPGSIEPVRDWGLYLQRWSPPLLTGGEMARTLSNGGVMASEITEGGYAWMGSSRPESALAMIRADEDRAHEALIESGTCVDPPADDERVWLVVIHPESGTASVNMGLDPLPANLEECPKDEE